MENTNEIALRSKITEELYAEGNREFLAKYDTDDKQIDYYTDLACKLYDEFQIDGSFTFAGVRANVAMWYNNKQKQMELFRKHPYWDEEAKAIVFLQTETRAIDYEVAAYTLGKLQNYVLDNCPSVNDCQWLIHALICALNKMADKEEQTGVLTDAFIEKFKGELYSSTVIPKPIAQMLRSGTKITRLVRKCFENIKLSDDSIFNATTMADEDDDPRTRKSFDKYYAIFADCLSELMIERITLVSLNFLDFMTMSNGNSWSSCHFINSHGIFHEDAESSYRGQYKQGCLSYALDEPSMILYTLPTTFTGTDYYRCQKLNRMCCQYENGVLITGKCYPNNQDSLITRYRQMMQLILSQVTEIPNLWTFSRKVKKVVSFVETADNAGHYHDYEYESQKPTISLCKGAPIDLDMAITIGHEGYCVHCGRTLSNCDRGWLQCDSHRRTKTCSYCGVRLSYTDECLEIDGKYYCPDHVFYCEFHNRYESLDDKFGTITMGDGENVVCKDTVMYEVQKCKDCGRYFVYDDMNGGYCSECIKNYVHCSGCGEYVAIDKAYWSEDRAYCDDCQLIAKSRLTVRASTRYKKGDYVLMCEDVSCCNYGANGSMQRNYANRIVRIEDNYGTISPLDGRDWCWSNNCFVGIVENCKEEYIGKTIAEVAEMIKEAAHEH